VSKSRNKKKVPKEALDTYGGIYGTMALFMALFLAL
jgi:hypothetical protein